MTDVTLENQTDRPRRAAYVEHVFLPIWAIHIMKKVNIGFRYKPVSITVLGVHFKFIVPLSVTLPLSNQKWLLCCPVFHGRLFLIHPYI